MPSNIRPFRALFRPRELWARVLVYTLTLSFCLPLPLADPALARSAATEDVTAHVLARLQSESRRQSIAEAAKKDLEDRANASLTDAAPAAKASAPSSAALPATAVSAAPSSSRAPLFSPRALPDRAVSGPDGPAVASPQVPKSLSQVLADQAAAFMGVPGPVGYQRDEGLGFHQDGTVRKAGGSGSSSTDVTGRRASSYATSGLGYSPYGNGPGIGLGSGSLDWRYGPGYDPVTGENFRVMDPTAGGRRDLSGLYGDSFDPSRAMMQRGLSYGLGAVNSVGEAALSSLIDGGRARLNFMIDWNGKVQGEGDVLYPFYDSQYTTVYAQLGGRSMNGSEDTYRWIGNLGVGQRWFPGASSLKESGNWMLGYNAFFDYDFTRTHQRGGFGVEAQYDWLRLASNYYFPISSWRDSEDFDSDLVKERPAEGWDVRLKGYLPFYRNVALTGAYSQWYGDNVGMFSSSKLEKDPKVWSYGLEYTPVPLVSGFFTQRQTEQGRSDTEFGVRFTYHFQMPWEDQISHAKVAELRTVGGSRHEFVDREHKIILEYKAKDKFNIEYLGMEGTNVFVFRLKNGFDKPAANQRVRATANGGVVLAQGPAQDRAAPDASSGFFARAGNALGKLFSIREAHAADLFHNYVTDGNGIIRVRGLNVPGTFTLTLEAGDTTRTFTLNGIPTNTTLKLNTPQEFPVGVGASSVRFTLSNPTFPNLVANQTVNLSWSGAGAFLNPPTSATTDANGSFTLNLTGLTAGPVTLTVTMPGGGTSTTTITVAPSILSLAQTPAQTFSVGGQVDNAGFTLSDTGGVALVASKAVTLAWSGSGAFASPPTSATTDANGKFTLNLKGQTAGAVMLTVTLPDARTTTATLTVAQSALTLVQEPAQTFITGATANNVGFALKDGTAPVANKAVTLAWSGSGAFASPPATATTDASGTFVLSALTGQTTGSVTLTVTLPDSRTATCTLTVAEAVNYVLTPSVSSFTAGSATSANFTLTRNAQPVASTNVTLSWSSPTAFASQPATATTNASGVFSLNLTGAAAGTVTLTAALSGGGSASCTLTVTAAPTYALTSSVASFTAGSATNADFTLTSNGAAVASTALALSWSSPTAFASQPATASTDASGVFSLNLTGQTIGIVTITATWDSGTKSASCVLPITGPSGPFTEVVTNNAPADNASQNSAKARFFEANGFTPASGQTITWSVQGGTPSGITLGTPTVTDASGWSSITVTDGGRGNRDVVLEASYGGVTRTVTVHFGAPVLSLSNIQKSEANPARGGSSTVTVDVKFADGSAAVDLTGGITWTTRNNASASAQASTATSGTSASGVASFSASSGLQHVMYVQATAGSSSQNTTVQFGGTLPAGFITGADVGGNWSYGSTFCANQGGTLPSVMQLQGISGGSAPAGWRTNADYWSGEGLASGLRFAVHLSDGADSAYPDFNAFRVVCVSP